MNFKKNKKGFCKVRIHTSLLTRYQLLLKIHSQTTQHKLITLLTMLAITQYRIKFMKLWNSIGKTRSKTIIKKVVKRFFMGNFERVLPY